MVKGEPQMHRCTFLSHSGLRLNVSPAGPSSRQVFWAEGSKQVQPWLWQLTAGLCEGQMDMPVAWGAQAGGTKALGWLLWKAHGNALCRMFLSHLISTSKLFSALFHANSK